MSKPKSWELIHVLEKALWPSYIRPIIRKIVGTQYLLYIKKFQDAVEYIRKKRRGAINTKQLEFLAKYKRKKYFIKVSS